MRLSNACSFETAYLLNVYAFGWNDSKRVHPTGEDIPWSKEEADLTDFIIILLTTSSKTAASSAQQLRQNRPSELQPSTIIGVFSSASKVFTEKTGRYDDVFPYSDVQGGIDVVSATKGSKVILFDFGARENALANWHGGLAPIVPNLACFRLGMEVKPITAQEMMQIFIRCFLPIFTKIGEMQQNLDSSKNSILLYR
jgi:hypothetical protein